jgi:hypothetical protein
MEKLRIDGISHGHEHHKIWDWFQEQFQNTLYKPNGEYAHEELCRLYEIWLWG